MPLFPPIRISSGFGGGRPLTGGGPVKVVPRAVTAAEFLTLGTSPITLLPAPAAGYAIVPIYYTAIFTNVSGTLGNSPTFQIKHSGAAAGYEWVSTTWGPTQGPGQRGRSAPVSNSLLFETSPATRWPVAKALTIALSANPSPGTVVVTMEVSVTYYVQKWT